MLARWTDTRDHELMVVSRDISDEGILFYAPAKISLGTEVEIILTRPSEPHACGNKRLCVHGTVVRAETAEWRTGYALTVTHSETLAEERHVSTHNASSQRRSRLRGRLLSCAALIVLMVVVVIFAARQQILSKILQKASTPSASAVQGREPQKLVHGKQKSSRTTAVPKDPDRK